MDRKGGVLLGCARAEMITSGAFPHGNILPLGVVDEGNKMSVLKHFLTLVSLLLILYILMHEFLFLSSEMGTQIYLNRCH